MNFAKYVIIEFLLQFSTTVPDKIGMHATDEELEDYVFFWRCVGHQLGIPDEFNLCGRGRKNASGIFWEIINTMIVPDSKSPPPNYNKMADAYIGGLNLSIGFDFFSVKSTVATVYWSIGQPMPELSITDTARYLTYRMLFWFTAHVPVI